MSASDSSRSLSERSETKRPVAASVIVPSYRGAERLPELLECLTRQDFEGEWEVVVALDGEFDDSRAILATYEDRLPLRVIASETNRGVSETLNSGYGAAVGEVLIRCDDDLSPKPHMVRQHVQLHAESDVPLGVIGATGDVFADTPYARAYGVPANRRGLEAVYQRSEDQTWMHWAAHNSISHETWERSGGFDPAFNYREDSEFGFRLHEAGVRIVVDRELEIEHRGPAPSAAIRMPRAFVSGASLRTFEAAHPDAFASSRAVRGRPSIRTLSGIVWGACVTTTSLVIRSPQAYRRIGHAIDALPPSTSLSLRGRLVALGVEAAAQAGKRIGTPGSASFSWQSTRPLVRPLPDADSPSHPRLPLALWLVPVADLGGVARHVLDATRAGVPGWRIVVLCPEGPLADKLRSQGAAVTTARFGPGAGVRTSRTSLRRAARSLRPDIVHSHLAYADIINAWTPLPRDTRRFTTEHGIAGDDSVYHDSGWKARAMAAVHRARFPRFDGVIAVSQATRRTMISKWHVKQHIEVIPNGVDLPPATASRGTAPGALRVLSLSRLAPEKRIDLLIEGFAEAKRRRPDATLVIAGEGPLAAELRGLARRLSVDDATTFPGYVEAHEALDNADVIVQLSVWENLSYTLLDAAARGIPIVATDVGGNNEIVSGDALLTSLDRESIADALVHSVQTHRPDVRRMPTSIATMCAHVGATYSREAAC